MAKKFLTPIDMGTTNKIINLAPGTDPQDGVNVSQLQNAVTGAMTYQGGYNAATNVPSLTANDGSVSLGFTYTVTTAGTFLGQDVEVGDVIVAEVDNPTVAADFTIVNKNIPAQAPATETLAGVAEIATQAETDAGTDDTRIVTPLKLTTWATNENLTKKFVQTNVQLGDTPGAQTITHALGTNHFSVTLQDTTTGEEYEADITSKTTTTVVVTGYGATTVVDVVIIG